MTLRRSILLAVVCLWAVQAQAAKRSPLPKPEGLSVTYEEGTPVFHWAAVPGAGVYRLAVWAAPTEEGARPLIGAVWTRNPGFGWGRDSTVAKLAKLPSTSQEPLAAGQPYRWMVSAARVDGSGKGDWSGAELIVPKQQPVAPATAPARQSLAHSATPTPSATASPSPTPAPSFSPTPGGAEAEIEVDLGSDFTEQPAAGAGAAAAVLNVGDSVEPASPSSSSLSSAQALLENGDLDAAETAYKNELTKNPLSADAWEGLGRSYNARNLKLEAKEAFEKALAIDPSREDLKQWIEKNTRR